MSSSKGAMTLHSLYPRALLSAPRPALSLAEVKDTAAVDPLAPSPVRTKGLIKADIFHRYQRLRPAVVLAFVERTRLSSGPSQWKQCMDELKALSELCRSRQVRLVIAVLDTAAPPVATMEEFQSIVMRDLAVDPTCVLYVTTPKPEESQIDALKTALLGQAQATYKEWQAHLYRKMQFQSLQPDAYDAVVRTALKLAHVCELAHQWQSAKSKYSEAYHQLSYVMQLARQQLNPCTLCAVCSAADWCNMKLTLYCIGGGVANETTVRYVLTQWRLHRNTFCRPIEGAPLALQGWHHGWVARQHQAMLMTVNQYLREAPHNQDALELAPYFLMEGCTSAALARRDLAAQLPSPDSGDVVLDVARVSPSPWLGMYVVKGADGTSRQLTSSEMLVYLAYLERTVDHNSAIASVLQGSIDACGLSIGVFSAATYRRRLLVLCARKARHAIDTLPDLAAKDPAAVQAARLDARALLLQSCVQFRKDGWLKLLAHNLEYLRMCTDLHEMRRAHVITCLELASLAQGALPLSERQALAHAALEELLQTRTSGCDAPPPEDPAPADPPPGQPPSAALNYVIQWGDMSGTASAEHDISGSIEDHGWLNVVHLSLGFCPPASDPDDITLGVALKSQLPEGVALPLDGVSVVVAADKGYISMAATQLPDETSLYYMPPAPVDVAPNPNVALQLPLTDVKWQVVAPPMSAAMPHAPAFAAGARPLPGDAQAGTSALHDDVLAAFAKSALSEAPTSVRTSVAESSEPKTPPSPWRFEGAASVPGDAVLQGGRWQVFGVRFRPAGATSVKVKSVTLHFCGGYRAVWHVATAFSFAEPSTMPTLFSGCPASDSTLAVTGPHAPFASSSINFIPGKLALLLHYDSPPPLVAIVPSDNVLVNDAARVAVTILPQASVSGAKLVVLAPCRSPVSASKVLKGPGEFIVIQTRVGASWAAGKPIRGTDEIDLPDLWKGERLVVDLWVQVDTPCDVELSVAVSDGAGTVTDPIYASFTVAEPFRFEAQFVAPDQASLLLCQPPKTAPWAAGPNPAAPFNVAAGMPCVMSLLITAAAACPLLLRAVKLTGTVEGWQQLGSTADSTLAGGAVVMRKGDVHSVFLYLVAPEEAQLSPLGALDVEWRRAGPLDGEVGAENASTSGRPDVAGDDYLQLHHPLPAVFVNDVVLHAALSYPSTVKNLAMFELVLEVTNHTAEVQTMLCKALGHPGITVETETQSTVAIGAGQSQHVFWHVRGTKAGLQRLPLVTIECPGLQVSCRSMDSHVLVQGAALKS